LPTAELILSNNKCNTSEKRLSEFLPCPDCAAWLVKADLQRHRCIAQGEKRSRMARAKQFLRAELLSLA